MKVTGNIFSQQKEQGATFFHYCNYFLIGGSTQSSKVKLELSCTYPSVGAYFIHKHYEFVVAPTMTNKNISHHLILLSLDRSVLSFLRKSNESGPDNEQDSAG